MKNIKYTLRKYMLLVILLATSLGYSQINVNTTPVTDNCNLNGENVSISVPTEVLTGDNIALNITLPGYDDATCTKKVAITTSSNLNFQTSAAFPLTTTGANSYESGAIPVDESQSFNVLFKFPNYTTCNGTVGTFTVTTTLDCNGVVTTCTKTVSIIARADNYWSISKQFITGDLTCGTSRWRVRLAHNNPNGSGLGTYKISGTITETPTVPIVSGSSFLVNISGSTNSTWVYNVVLENCSNAGTTITNTASYNLTLGDGTCDTMSGTVTATSPPLASPNASISFTKNVDYASTTNLTPGCEARYRLRVCNNGNVPWTDLQITDDLNIPGITITGMNLAGWTVTPSIPPYPATTYTFTRPGFVLNPGECTYVFINFTIDPGAAIGSTITNTANLSYTASGVGSSSGGGSSSSCPGVVCPTIDTAIQNTSDSASFVVEAPKAIPSIKKCIINPPNTLVPPLYQIGDTISYSIMIGNSGSGDLTTTLSDALGAPQNLQIIPGSISYEYYANQGKNYRHSCNPYLTTGPVAPPFSVVADTTDLQNPTWSINSMPGICDLFRSNFLVIKFDALILPQLSGNKLNKATIPNGASTLSSTVNYSIDEVGILEVHKEADEEIVENGQPFNYTITVSNNGSVPLDNIVVTDMLPECVSLNGQITIKDELGTFISSTTSGGLVITVNPTAQIMPGIDYIITIPVIKSGSGNCCNERVSVNANMTTSGAELTTSYGSESAPAACVKSTECCDIEDFEASITQSGSSFNVMVNGGSIPLQEVEISMVDYHVEYSSDDCKPDDMGNFGILSTSNTNLGNLVLTAGDNNTSSLSWLLGSPSLINTNVNLNIPYPNVLALDCCDVKYSFCLKVKVKDVDCNVCEKIICFSNDQQSDPCEIEIKPFRKKEFCVGETINLNWSGTTTTGLVNISLYDVTNGVVYQVLASGIPNTGSFNYTIPSSFPCDPDKTWVLIVEDAEGNCIDKSDEFIIDCCDQQLKCDCGKWQNDLILIKEYERLLQVDSKRDMRFERDEYSMKMRCGEEISLRRSLYYSFTAPTFICDPEDCETNYTWAVHNESAVINAGTGKTFNYTFTSADSYKVVFTPVCGGKRCDPCIIYVNVKQGEDSFHLELLRKRKK